MIPDHDENTEYYDVHGKRIFPKKSDINRLSTVPVQREDDEETHFHHEPPHEYHQQHDHEEKHNWNTEESSRPKRRLTRRETTPRTQEFIETDFHNEEPPKPVNVYHPVSQQHKYVHWPRMQLKHDLQKHMHAKKTTEKSPPSNRYENKKHASKRDTSAQEQDYESQIAAKLVSQRRSLGHITPEKILHIMKKSGHLASQDPYKVNFGTKFTNPKAKASPGFSNQHVKINFQRNNLKLTPSPAKVTGSKHTYGMKQRQVQNPFQLPKFPSWRANDDKTIKERKSQGSFTPIHHPGHFQRPQHHQHGATNHHQSHYHVHTHSALQPEPHQPYQPAHPISYPAPHRPQESQQSHHQESHSSVLLQPDGEATIIAAGEFTDYEAPDVGVGSTTYQAYDDFQPVKTQDANGDGIHTVLDVRPQANHDSKWANHPTTAHHPHEYEEHTETNGHRPHSYEEIHVEEEQHQPNQHQYHEYQTSTSRPSYHKKRGSTKKQTEKLSFEPDYPAGPPSLPQDYEQDYPQQHNSHKPSSGADYSYQQYEEQNHPDAEEHSPNKHQSPSGFGLGPFDFSETKEPGFGTQDPDFLELDSAFGQKTKHKGQGEYSPPSQPSPSYDYESTKGSKGSNNGGSEYEPDFGPYEGEKGSKGHKRGTHNGYDIPPGFPGLGGKGGQSDVVPTDTHHLIPEYDEPNPGYESESQQSKPGYDNYGGGRPQIQPSPEYEDEEGGGYPEKPSYGGKQNYGQRPPPREYESHDEGGARPHRSPGASSAYGDEEDGKN